MLFQVKSLPKIEQKYLNLTERLQKGKIKKIKSSGKIE